MSDKTNTQSTSQTQHGFPFPAPMTDAIRKATEAQIARVQAFYDSAAQWETRGAEQAKNAIEESARLARETMQYTTQMSAEWRKLSLDAVRNAFQMFTPPSA